MRVNAVNMLRQAAHAIDPDKDVGAYEFMLGELSQHLAMVRDGQHTWDEFAEAYCLTERDRKAV
jgi:hypothetical protein